MPTSKEDNVKILVDIDIKGLRAHLGRQGFNVETGVPEDMSGVDNDKEWQEFLKSYSAFEEQFKKLLVKKWSFFSQILSSGR